MTKEQYSRLVPDDSTPEEQAKVLEELLRMPAEPPKTGNVVFGIAEFSDGYSVSGINYRGINSCDFAKATLPSRTQDQHAEHARQAKPDEFRASSAPLVYAICKALYKNKDGAQKELVEKTRRTVEGIIGPGKPWIIALSRAKYNPQGLDEVVHDYKQPTQYSKNVALVGPDGFITKPETKAEAYAQALLDTTDKPEEINAVFKWITGNDSYAYRLNATPKQAVERVVALGVNDDVRFNLIVSVGIIDVNWPALGVRGAKKFP